MLIIYMIYDRTDARTAGELRLEHQGCPRDIE
jgi:hypothetical protein